MSAGVSVFVEDGFATIDVLDRDLRASVLNSILAATPPALIEQLTRSGPRKQWRIPVGNAITANIADIAQIYELTDRVDTHFAAELDAADPWGEQPDNAGPWTTPLPDVSATGYIAMPTTEGPVQESDLEGQPQDANGIINGPLRPNQPVATSVPEVPAAATLTASELQAYVKAGSQLIGGSPFGASRGRPRAADAVPEGEPSTDWSRRQLDTYAANLGIDTSRLLNKASVVEAINNVKPSQ